MQIKTTKPNLLILDECHPLGAVVDVPDAIGKRLVERNAASPFVSVPCEVETATMRVATETASISRATRAAKRA